VKFTPSRGLIFHFKTPHSRLGCIGLFVVFLSGVSMASLNCKKCGTIHPVCDNFVKPLTWIPIDVDLPDDEIAVLMHIEECERPFFGYKIGDQWWHDCGDVVAGTVLHWCDLPEVPE
jgi:hypothetical protein